MNEPERNEPEAGTLYVVATPIGNLGDFSPRAVKLLSCVDLILAEDTRTFGILAKRFNIETPKQSYHDHNEKSRTPAIISRLQSGQSVALVCESGTPAISDPGFRVVSACQESNIPVRTIPGPCAAIAAISISGFETDAFSFQGFLPTKAGKRSKALKEALEQRSPTIFYESPFRIMKTLQELLSLAPQREVFLARELTKRYEETFRGSTAKVLEELSLKPSIKGEFVLILRGTGAKKEKDYKAS